MISVTYNQAVNAFRALVSIGQKELPPKATIRAARLIGELRAVTAAFDDAKRKQLLAVGGEERGDSLGLWPPVRKDDEADEAFRAREEAHAAAVAAFGRRLTEMGEEKVEVNVDPLPFDLLQGEGVTLRPVDIVDAGPFVVE